MASLLLAAGRVQGRKCSACPLPGPPSKLWSSVRCMPYSGRADEMKHRGPKQAVSVLPCRVAPLSEVSWPMFLRRCTEGDASAGQPIPGPDHCGPVRPAD